MAFKMKGSAFKLGNVATKSVLKQKSPIKSEGGWLVNPTSREPNAPQGTPQWAHGPNERGEYIEYDNEGRAEHTKAEHRRGEIENPVDDTEDSGPKMKSPLEQGVNTLDMAQRSRESEEGFLKKNLRKGLNSIDNYFNPPKRKAKKVLRKKQSRLSKLTPAEKKKTFESIRPGIRDIVPKQKKK